MIEMFDWLRRKKERPCVERKSEIESLKYPIYCVTAPFGILMKSTRGGGSGDHYYGWSWHVSTSLEEKYVIKYMDGKRLRSKIIDAEDAHVEVDGTFVLEERREHYYIRRDGGEWVKKYGKNDDGYLRDRIIHLPELPEPEFKTTSNFTQKI